MTATSLYYNRPGIGRGHHWAGFAENGAGFDAGPDMQRECRIGLGVGVDQTILDHQPGAAISLLTRLEHKLDCAGQLVAMAVQQVHRLDQHRRMRVVTTGVHAAGNLAGIVEPGFFRHRQRVHVAAQQHGSTRLGAAERYDEARGRWSASDVHFETAQPIEHRFGRQRQIEPQFGLGMNAPAQRHRGGQQPACFVKEAGQFGHAHHSPHRYGLIGPNSLRQIARHCDHPVCEANFLRETAMNGNKKDGRGA